MWNAWNGPLYSEISCWSCCKFNSMCLLLHLIHYWLMRMTMHSIGVSGWLWFLLQRSVWQSNFDDTLECMDRVEQSTGPVSFALYMCGSALLYWHYYALLSHYSSTAGVVFECTLVVVHACCDIYHTCAYPCARMRARLYVTMIMMCMYHCMCWRY